MIHPNTELRLIDESIGYGVFATAFIPQGTITYVKDSLELEFSPEAYRSHPPTLQTHIDKYSYIDERGYRIVSWDFAKYVNHCCHANTLSTGYGFEVAIRDIQPGEQITDEYAMFNLTEPMPVNCGGTGCRGCVQPEDFDRLVPVWDGKLLAMWPNVYQVAQPLWELLSDTVQAQLAQAKEDPAQYRSVGVLKYRRDWETEASPDFQD